MPDDEDVGEPVVSVADAAPLIAAPGGTTFGIAVHEVLERVDFTSPTLPADMEDLVAAVSRRSGLELDVAATAAGLRAVVDTPLGELFDGRPLAAFSTTDRLAELTFDLTFGSARIAAADIGKVLSTTLDGTDPLADYGHHLASALAVTELAGWLTGSIDAVFRVGTTDPRFVVVDYKSNRLHDRRCDRPARRVPTRPARRGDDAQSLPAAGPAVLRRPAPLPPLAARGRVLPGAPPRRRRLPVRARDDRRGHAHAGRRDLWRVLVAPAHGDDRRPRSVAAGSS